MVSSRIESSNFDDTIQNRSLPDSDLVSPLGSLLPWPGGLTFVESRLSSATKVTKRWKSYPRGLKKLLKLLSADLQFAKSNFVLLLES